MPFFRLSDVSFNQKTVLVRLGLDSPVDPASGAVIMNDRLVESAETISFLSSQGAKVVCLGHQGRPGKPDFTSTQQHAQLLSQHIGKPITYIDQVFGDQVTQAVAQMKQGDILMLANARSAEEEMIEQSPEQHAQSNLVRSLEPLFDYYVNDAFSNCHRAHASMIGFVHIPNIVSDHVAREIEGIQEASHEAKRPFLFVLGGAKIDDYIGVMKAMLAQHRVDKILVGGMLGDVVLAAQGIDLGAPEDRKLAEKDSLTHAALADLVPDIQDLMKQYPGVMEPPVDVAIDQDGVRVEILVADLPTTYTIKDIGTKTIQRFSHMIAEAGTIFVKGPMGLYEEETFATGSREIIRALADTKAYTLVGGGNTASVIDTYSSKEKFDHISLAGGATLTMLEKGTLPCIEAFEQNYEKHKHVLTH